MFPRVRRAVARRPDRRHAGLRFGIGAALIGQQRTVLAGTSVDLRVAVEPDRELPVRDVLDESTGSGSVERPTRGGDGRCSAGWWGKPFAVSVRGG
jgi:hypothetical protein